MRNRTVDPISSFTVESLGILELRHVLGSDGGGLSSSNGLNTRDFLAGGAISSSYFRFIADSWGEERVSEAFDSEF